MLPLLYNKFTKNIQRKVRILYPINYNIMIICFNKKINNFSEKKFKKFNSHDEQISYIQSLMPDITDISANECPFCHARNKLVKYGKYNRNLSILVDNSVETFNISVQRVKCKSCSRTHALLPNFIVPYKIMAIFSIAQIVQKAALTSAYQLSEAINISYQAIYQYIACVISFFASFKIMNNSKEYYKTQKFNENFFLTNCVKNSSSKFRLDYFEFYNWVLFMQKFRNKLSTEITIGVSNTLST